MNTTEHNPSNTTSSILEVAAHTVIPFVSGKTVAFTGQRLAVVTYKTITDKSNALCGVKRESKAVSLPRLSDDTVIDNITTLLPHVKQMLYKVQDSIIRERLDAGNNVALITAEEVNITAICEYLDNSGESGRLTKESVGAWFDSSIADTLMIALADKLGVSDTPSDIESKQIEVIVTGFRDKIAALAGGKTSYEPKLCESIKKCLVLAGNDDVLGNRFIARLDKMIADSGKNELLLFDAL